MDTCNNVYNRYLAQGVTPRTPFLNFVPVGRLRRTAGNTEIPKGSFEEPWGGPGGSSMSPGVAKWELWNNSLGAQGSLFECADRPTKHADRFTVPDPARYPNFANLVSEPHEGSEPF